MQVAIGSDHGGFKLKQNIISDKNYFIDCGTFSEESVDYPDIAKKVVDFIINKQVKYGILICKSGIGMSIAANRYKDVRAALCHDSEEAQLARQHNNANILVLAANKTNLVQANELIDIFTKTDFSAGRHVRRLNKIDN